MTQALALPSLIMSLASVGSGAIVGLVLGLVGGGGSIMATPLLVYVVGIASPHLAIGTSAVAVSASALGNLGSHWRAGNVKWRCAAVFSLVGVLGAFVGSAIAKSVDGQKLLALFGALMVVVGLAMLRKKSGEGRPDVRLTISSAANLLPKLASIGFGVGLFSGFFGIGGGFLIVPGLMLATGMPLTLAIGTSLVAVSAFGAATAASYSLSGLVNWPVAVLFVLGGLGGGLVGVQLGKVLSTRKQALNLVFATLVIVVGAYIVVRGYFTLSSGA
ncbi:MAG TPA: sulfite exporter TauE/SafE family protein [Beijerinckiaceae bacterium]|nr:sulfite exporter TauE/SafE family protein [Beijerinckiaceae bacterium]